MTKEIEKISMFYETGTRSGGMAKMVIKRNMHIAATGSFKLTKPKICLTLRSQAYNYICQFQAKEVV